MTSKISCFAICFLLGATIGSAVPRPQSETPSASPAHTTQSTERKPAPPGLPNFSEVTPTLYRGGQPTNQGFGGLSKMGIDIVIDLRGSGEPERKEVTRLGMQYVPIPWHCYQPKDELFAQFLTLLRENAGKKVFVHCRLGNDRTGMMVAAYRISEQGWTAEEAMKDMEIHGYSSFHHMICPRLASYEAEFPRVLKTSPAFQKLRDTALPTPDH
jgi:protein-tyrosine phosphatase